MSRRAQENVVALALLLLFIGFLVVGMSYSPKARLVPVPLAIVSILLISLQLFLQNFRRDIKLSVDTMELFARPPREDVCEVDKDVRDEVPGTEKSDGRKEIEGIGIMLLLVAMVLVLGMFPAVLVFVFGYFMVIGKSKLLPSAIYSVVTAGVLYVLFVSILGILPYEGLLGSVLQY